MANITVNLDSLKSFRKTKRHQIQPGSNVYRILPPFGDESVHNNYAYRKWTLVWMLDPASGRKRPFAVSFVKDKKDPITEYTTLLAERVEKLRDGFKAKGVSEEKIKETLSEVNKIIWELRPKTGYYYNACSKSGEVGVLELRKTAHDALKREMFQYIRDYAQDPTSLSSADDDSGVWFNITKEGEKGSKDTEYDARKNQIKIKKPNGGFSWEDDREALPEHVVQSYPSLGYDLAALYQTKTHEELYEILMANLAIITQAVPLAKIPGFDPTQHQFKEEVKLEEPAEEPIPFEEPPVMAAPPAPKKPVKLNVAEEGDEMPVTKKPAAAAPTKPTIDDDVFALADSILNG